MRAATGKSILNGIAIGPLRIYKKAEIKTSQFSALTPDIVVYDVGTNTPESFPYAISGCKVAKLAAEVHVDAGLLICGTGVGISLAANKVKGIRACVCSDTATARLIRQHNNSSILSLGARIVGLELAKDIVDAWLNAEFKGGRHQARIDMITEIKGTGNLKAEELLKTQEAAGAPSS